MPIISMTTMKKGFQSRRIPFPKQQLVTIETWQQLRTRQDIVLFDDTSNEDQIRNSWRKRKERWNKRWNEIRFHLLVIQAGGSKRGAAWIFVYSRGDFIRTIEFQKPVCWKDERAPRRFYKLPVFWISDCQWNCRHLEIIRPLHFYGNEAI